MPQAVVDPEELRQFAQALQRFNIEVYDRFTALTSRLAALGETWRDQEHDRFLEQFEQHLKLLQRFLEMSDRHVPYLVRKADQIDDYLHSSS